MEHKGAAVLVAEPDTKRGRDQPESSKGSRPFCAFHNLHTHNTNDCQEIRAIREERFGRRLERRAILPLEGIPKTPYSPKLQNYSEWRAILPLGGLAATPYSPK